MLLVVVCFFFPLTRIPLIKVLFSHAFSLSMARRSLSGFRLNMLWKTAFLSQHVHTDLGINRSITIIEHKNTYYPIISPLHPQYIPSKSHSIYIPYLLVEPHTYHISLYSIISPFSLHPVGYILHCSISPMFRHLPFFPKQCVHTQGFLR